MLIRVARVQVLYHICILDAYELALAPVAHTPEVTEPQLDHLPESGFCA